MKTKEMVIDLKTTTTTKKMQPALIKDKAVDRVEGSINTLEPFLIKP